MTDLLFLLIDFSPKMLCNLGEKSIRRNLMREFNYQKMPGSKDRGEGSWRGLETILTSDLAVLKSLLECYE